MVTVVPIYLLFHIVIDSIIFKNALILIMLFTREVICSKLDLVPKTKQLRIFYWNALLD